MPPDRQHSPSSSHPTETQVNACLRCRTRKKKCDRLEPQCGTCARANAECTYEVPVSEGLQKRLIDKLSAELESHKAQIAELQRRLDSQAGSQTLIFPNLDTLSPVSARTAVSEDVTFAESIVQQVFDGEVDLVNTQQSLLASTAQRLGLPINQTVVNVNTSDAPVFTLHTINSSVLPPKQMAELMIDMYFNYTNCFQPVLDRETITEDMNAVYPLNPQQPSLVDTVTGPNVRLFRFFMVLAIGCNVLPKPSDDHHDVARLRACAAAHFPAALRSDALTCMICIVLYCVVSMTDSATMDPYQNVRRAAKMALRLGFHRDDESLPWHIRETRRRIFWSVFSMDRSICFTLIRPVTVPEDIIATSLPQTVPDLLPMHTAFMRPLALLHSTVLLRRLQGIVITDINLATGDQDKAENTAIRVRNQIDSWYESLPRTGPRGRVPPYLEVNYHLLLVRLYSPSSLIPHTAPADMPTLRESAYRVIEMYGAQQDDYRIARNHITLSHIVACSVALVYTLLECESSPSNLRLISWRRRALQQVEAAERYLEAFCSRSPHAASYPEAFRILTQDVKNRLNEVSEDVPQSSWASLSQLSDMASIIPTTYTDTSDATLVENMTALPERQQQQQQYVLPWDMLSTSREEQISDMVLGDVESRGDDNIDDFLATFGLGAFSA
ncbi:fungal-specific transcription factor domain-domain-containing protein [Naematelia encephala]|uniref:Fungal-specific transcription factor domain-domain-containing protein n=1 Tax=Naematelia encephala TaxID=71784 RepID=A0A1Y2BDI0_9TREE|nr:fungal-specific transcription factor domain-domain-containing protein [Naematelia encephala]